MPLTLIATPAASNANSYCTLSEFGDYLASRGTVPLSWNAVDDGALINATRVLSRFLAPYRYLVPAVSGIAAHYITRSTWTGNPTTPTQALPWPRTGMFNVNGVLIDSMLIPQELKDAQCELAGQLSVADRTLDSDIETQGITAVRAGSVSVNFKQNVEAKVIPDAVWWLLLPSWLTDELVEPAMPAELCIFDFRGDHGDHDRRSS